MVHGLVHEDAAIVRPGAAPRFGVVVRLVARPSQPNRSKHEPAESALLQRLAGLQDRQVVAILMDDEELDTMRIAGLDHPVGVLEPQGERLFDDERTAVLDQVEHVLAVRAAWRQDIDDVNPIAHASHHLVDRRKPGSLELPGELARARPVQIHKSADFSFVQIVMQDMRVLARDTSAPHQRESQVAHRISSPPVSDTS